MSNYSTPQGKDPQLWHIARKRASFKSHLLTYIIINIFLWILWYLTGAKNNGNSIPWPAWTTIGWGVGVAFHYVGAYSKAGSSSIEKEYDKLTQKQINK